MQRDYKDILQDLLDRVPSNVDKREGSVIYDALAPCAYELAFMYLELDRFIQESFAVTASREYLIKRGYERGIEPHKATKGVFEAVFNIDVPIGSRFNLDKLNFVVIEKIKDKSYKVECETAGSISNSSVGDLIAIDYISGLESAKITKILELGQDEEDTESFRKRYFIKVREPATSGNVYHYRRWALEVSGVGGVKIYPLWNGNGTVKLVIVDNNMAVASEKILQDVRDYIEKNRPIGATVTVISAVSKEIVVQARIKKTAVSNIDDIKENIKKAFKNYIKDVSFNSDYISMAKIGNIILSNDDVLDYQNLTLNGIKDNIPIADDEVPIITDLILEVI